MDAIEYLKEKSRMTSECNDLCKKCGLSLANNLKGIGCLNFEARYPEQAVSIVEQWSKEHPVKTYLSVLLEKFPKVPLHENGLPKFCPEIIFGCEVWEECSNNEACNKCWNREFKEEP